MLVAGQLVVGRVCEEAGLGAEAGGLAEGVLHLGGGLVEGRVAHLVVVDEGRVVARVSAHNFIWQELIMGTEIKSLLSLVFGYWS